MRPLRKADNLTTLHMPIVLKSGCFNLLETSGFLKTCVGIALPLANVISFVFQVAIQKLKDQDI